MIRFRGFLEEEPERVNDLRRVLALWPFIDKYRLKFAWALAVLAVSFALELAIPFVVRAAIDGPVQDALSGAPVDWPVVFGYATAFIVTTLAGAGLGYGFALLTTDAGQRVIRDVRVALFGHILRLPLPTFARQSVGRLVTRVTTDVENLSELITTGLLLTLFDLVTIIGVLVVLVFLDVRIALFALAITPLFAAMSFVFRRFARRAYSGVRTKLGRQNAFLGELLGGLRTTRAFGRERDVFEHYSELNAGTRRAWEHTVTSYGVFFFFVDLSLRLSTAGLLWFGCHSILGGTMTAGLFVQCWLYFGKIGEPIRELGEKYNVLQSALASAERVQGLLEREPTPPEPLDPVQLPAGKPPTIRFESVSFAYRPTEPVLRAIDLEIHAGTTIAVVGPTGAGKSTLLAMISRLFDPDEGSVSIDGVPLPAIPLESLRRRIAVVPQDVVLFTGSILDNVRCFDPSMDRDTVEQALRAVDAWDIAQRFGGLDAHLEENGSALSLGERQLLSFARGLASDPDVLILDEATAHVDTATEARLQRGLRPLMAGRTNLIVAHRLSTVRRADEIMVMQQGSIVERGPHDVLMARDGAYAAMIRSSRSPA